MYSLLVPSCVTDFLCEKDHLSMRAGAIHCYVCVIVPTIHFSDLLACVRFLQDAYRKIPGDTCVGGWVPSKVPVLCPDTSPLSTRNIEK